MEKLIDISPDGYLIPMSDSTAIQSIMERLWEYESLGYSPNQIRNLLIDLRKDRFCVRCGNELPNILEDGEIK